MVSKNPSPTEGFYLDPNGMDLPGFGGPLLPANVNSTAAAEDDLSKKVRKPYTITKSRESWTEPEHDKFLEALQLFDRDWKKIKAFIGSKTVIQIRSHAQKYFLKVQKSGTNEHLPPPRPKRKAAHPYPQKAPKTAQVPSQPPEYFHTSPALLDSGYAIHAIHPDSSSILGNSNDPVNSWMNHPVPAPSFSTATKGQKLINSCSSIDSNPRIRSTETIDQSHNGHALRVLPDFAQVYTFIGSVFDPNDSGHSQKLKSMDPIDLETVLLLMRNLSINLTSPDFEDHRRLLSTYEIDSGAMIEDTSPGDLFCDGQKNLARSFGVQRQ